MRFIKYITISLFSLLLLFANMDSQAQDSLITAYCFHGQGADYRIFKNLTLSDNYKIVYISYPIPPKKSTLKEYACSMIDQIDTTTSYVFIGQSIGGMICTELTDILNPEKTIIISSAKCRKELPFRYRFQRIIPLNKIIPKRLIKLGALILQPIVEPDRNNDKETFKSMLKSKDPVYLKRTINMIINWDRKDYSDEIIHIHGDKDKTIPIRNVDHDFCVKDGSHMMILTRGEELSTLINSCLQ